MKTFAAVVILLITLSSCSTNEYVGEKPSKDVPTISIAEAISPANHGKEVTIRGTVLNVCKMEGCWMSVSDGTSSIRMSFANSAFVVPVDLEGEVLVQGVVYEEVYDAETAVSVLESMSTDASAVSEVTEDQRIPVMVASGVEFLETTSVN